MACCRLFHTMDVPVIEKGKNEMVETESSRRFRKIMMWLSGIIFGYQIISLATYSALIRSYTSDADKPLQDAFKTMVSFLAVALVFRAVSVVLWSSKKLKLYDGFKGKIILLLVSVVSTYIAGVMVGGAFYNASIIDEYRSIDRNIALVYVLDFMILGLTIFELFYSHINPKPSAKAEVLNGSEQAIATVAVVFFGLAQGLQILSAATAQKIGSASAQTTSSTLAGLLKDAAKTVFGINVAALLPNAALIIFYIIKALARWADNDFSGRAVFLFLSSFAWLMTTFAYGATLPKLGILNVYRSSSTQELQLGSDVFISVNNLLIFCAGAFYCELVALFLIHVVAFSRTRRAEAKN